MQRLLQARELQAYLHPVQNNTCAYCLKILPGARCV